MRVPELKRKPAATSALDQAYADRLVEEMTSFLLGDHAWTVEHVNHGDKNVRVRLVDAAAAAGVGRFVFVSFRWCLDRVGLDRLLADEFTQRGGCLRSRTRFVGRRSSATCPSPARVSTAYGFARAPGHSRPSPPVYVRWGATAGSRSAMRRPRMIPPSLPPCRRRASSRMIEAVSVTSNPRIVYSSDVGTRCASCGRPRPDCTCRDQRALSEPVPPRIVAKLRLEKKGRGGKTVTVVYGLPRNDAFLTSLCRELKRACAAGGTVVSGSVEIQGAVHDRMRDMLLKRGYLVKG